MTATRRLVLLFAAVLAWLPATQLMAQGSPWVHIHVAEEGDDGSVVRVNLPLALVETAINLAPAALEEKLKGGRLKLENTGMTVADMRRLWQELRASGNAEFVTVEEGDERIRVARQGDQIQIRIDDAGAGQPKVRVDVPIDVVDALLDGEGQELNLGAAISRLRAKRGDLVQVQDGRTQVRVWIDEQS